MLVFSIVLKLSVIIVNYNAKKELENCLLSLQKAVSGIQNEIIVIDNNSTDNSLEYLEPLFSEVKFIRNPDNVGFSKACNQGTSLSSGEIILFLNPDTIIPENCIDQCISYIKLYNNTGAVGVRMIDQNGKFLKESKRGFPSPAVSFYKLFGLTKIFPRSKTFGKYYMTHLPEKENNEVDVLSGAFMMISRHVFSETGGFDESFFMFGEDIDLSHRIKESGYKNYYLGRITITHLKGRSTLNKRQRIHHFYNAMYIFVKKHFKGNYPFIVLFFINRGIWIRKQITLISTLFLFI